MMSSPAEDKVTIIIKTLLRPRAIRRCVRSIRKLYPRIRIFVADDSGHKTYDGSNGHVDAYYLLPRDSGASCGRNYLVRQVTTEYVMVVDDDTIFDESTRIEYATEVLDSTPAIDMVAGFYRPARWWGCLEVDTGTGTLKRVFQKAKGVVAGFPIYDFVPQFYVARTQKIKEIGWDNELKTLDHLQFSWRARGRLNATVLPYFSSYNSSERNPEYDEFRWKRLRRYRRLQLRKLGEGIRRIEDVHGQGNSEQLLPLLDSRATNPPDGRRLQTSTLVIGLGTGRCGTLSLSLVLQEQFDQAGADITHERRPLLRWDASEAEVFGYLQRFQRHGKQFFGDVAFFYLPHVEAIMKWANQQQVRVRFVCLRRGREETVRSYINKIRPYNANHWMTHDGSRWTHDPTWDPIYPKFDTCKTMREAVGAYWDHYYEVAERLADEHPDCFGLFETGDLNCSIRLWALLQFVGASDSLRATVGARLNTVETGSWCRTLKLTHWTAVLSRFWAQVSHHKSFLTHLWVDRPPQSLPVWYVNLDRSEDRKRHIESQLIAAGVREYRRVAAVDGLRIEDPRGCSVDGVSFVNATDALASKAELGATLSHLKVAKMLVEDSTGVDVVCVVEDDMCFERFRDWPSQRLLRLADEAPDDWSILQLHCNNTDVLHLLALRRSTDPVLPRDSIDVVCKAWSAGAYLLSKSGAQALMRSYHDGSKFILTGGRVVADRLTYRIPGVYLVTDIMFTANGMGSLIAPHHNRVDEEACQLTRTLFAGPPAHREQRRELPAPAVFYLSSHLHTDGASSAHMDEYLRSLGVDALHRVRVRAILGSDITSRCGEVWGVPFENRCEDPGSRGDVASALSLLKCVFMVRAARLSEALVLGDGAMFIGGPHGWPQVLDLARRAAGQDDWDVLQLRCAAASSDAPPVSDAAARPLALLITERGARNLLHEYFCDGRFVLTGQRPDVWAMLRRACTLRSVDAP